MAHGHFFTQFLAERAGHEQIARVGDRFHDGDLQIAGAGCDQRKARELTRRGVDEQAGDHGLQGRKAGIARCDAQRKGDREVAEGDRDAVPEALAVAVGFLFQRDHFLLVFVLTTLLYPCGGCASNKK